MAEPKKKTATKKTSTGSKKSASKKTASKKTSKKVSSSPVTKTTASTPVVKKAAKKTSSTKVQKTTTEPAAFIRERIPEAPAQKSLTDMSMFTTLLALFVVALVVLGGYIYSRQRSMSGPSPALDAGITEPQEIRISSSVVLTPEIMSALTDLAQQISIGPEEVLTDVRKIEDVAVAQAEDPNFFMNTRVGDYVFGFKSVSVLYRPSTKEIIKTGTLVKPVPPVQ